MNAALADAPTVTWPGKHQPWPHQLAALEQSLHEPGFMYGIPMGGGKTATAFAKADAMDARRVLVLCPKSVVGVWLSQAAEHSHRTWHGWAGQVRGARGPKKNPTVAERATALIETYRAAIRLDRPFIAVVNFEAAPVGQMANLLLGTPWDLVIVDESHRIKSPSGVQSRFVGRLCSRVRNGQGHVLALTGTPMPHSPLDLWAQFRALNESLLGTSWTAFRARYGAPKVHYRLGDGTPVYLKTPRGQLIYEGVRPDRVDELTARVGRLMFQVDAGELDRQLGLDDPTDVYRTTRLSTASQRVYDALERDLIAQIDDTGSVVTAANAMVNVIRLAQATSGYAVDADTGAHRALCDPPEKAQLLADVLTDLDRADPVVVFARFHHDLDAIRQVAEASGRTYGELSGRRRDGLTSDSKMSAVDVLGAQLKSGGVGIDLTRARYGIYYSLDFSLADAMQSRKRLHRPGQTRKVTYIHLLAESTIDRAIYGALRRREEVVTAVLDRLKNRSTP